jgi:integral membrane protein
MMKKYFKTALGRLRLIGFLEGLSFVFLIGLAMPMKYFYGMPWGVKYFGWVHGVLFVLYVAAVFHAAVLYRWSFLKGFQALLASVIPFGPFFFDAQLVRDQRENLYRSKVRA